MSTTPRMTFTKTLCWVLLSGLSVSAQAELSPERQQALRYLVRQDCGSCHGMTLNGGLGPALTPAALTGKPAQLLVNSIVKGRPGTAMPPWEGLLSEPEAAWIVEQLLEGCPSEAIHRVDDGVFVDARCVG